MSTPQEIAREAAEAYTRQEYPDLCTGLSDDTADFFEIRDQLTALILTAAAKMVRESGAVEALAHSPSYDRLKGGFMACPYSQLSEWVAARDAALNQLRAIGEARQGDS